ncbi:hypothetical protein F4778DRAFT_784059 [Xylariomycetidae sp. FL2044]|nr:hypothetical protein F4778DRAFT_784059 [Xylariomycetidae sp. FL2044]
MDAIIDGGRPFTCPDCNKQYRGPSAVRQVDKDEPTAHLREHNDTDAVAALDQRPAVWLVGTGIYWYQDGSESLVSGEKQTMELAGDDNDKVTSDDSVSLPRAAWEEKGRGGKTPAPYLPGEDVRQARGTQAGLDRHRGLLRRDLRAYLNPSQFISPSNPPPFFTLARGSQIRREFFGDHSGVTATTTTSPRKRKAADAGAAADEDVGGMPIEKTKGKARAKVVVSIEDDDEVDEDDEDNEDAVFFLGNYNVRRSMVASPKTKYP